MNSINGDKRIWQCPHCVKKPYINHKPLITHIRRKHKEPNPEKTVAGIAAKLGIYVGPILPTAYEPLSPNVSLPRTTTMTISGIPPCLFANAPSFVPSTVSPTASRGLPPELANCSQCIVLSQYGLFRSASSALNLHGMFHTRNQPIRALTPEVQLSPGLSFPYQSKDDATKGGSSVEQSSGYNNVTVSLRGKFTCGPCGRAIKDVTGLKTHQLLKHNIPMTCPEVSCSAIFHKLEDYYSHIRTATHSLKSTDAASLAPQNAPLVSTENYTIPLNAFSNSSDNSRLNVVSSTQDLVGQHDDQPHESPIDPDPTSHPETPPECIENIISTTVAGTATICDEAVVSLENVSPDPPNFAAGVVSSLGTQVTATSQPSSLQNMMRCPYCLKQTSTSKSLKKHIRKHRHIWACSACSIKPYIKKKTLRKHILREHQHLSPDSIIEKIKNTEAYKTFYLGVIPKSSTMTVEPVPSVSDVIVSPSTALENDASIAEDTSEGGELTECNEHTENESTVESELVAATMPEDTPCLAPSAVVHNPSSSSRCSFDDNKQDLECELDVGSDSVEVDAVESTKSGNDEIDLDSLEDWQDVDFVTARPSLSLDGETQTGSNTSGCGDIGTSIGDSETVASKPMAEHKQHDTSGDVVSVTQSIVSRAMTKWDCRICMSDPHDPVVAVCGHIFCQRCIIKRLANSMDCPVCYKVFFVKLNFGML